MANSAQARKRNRQSEKRRLSNSSQKSRMRTAVKTANKALAEGDFEQAKAAYRLAQSAMDKVAEKGIIHPNTVARSKCRLSAKLKHLSQSVG